MAFNPRTDITDTNAPTWVGASRGTQSSLDALGTLFHGIGQTADIGITNLDQNNQFQIEQQANKSMDTYLNDAITPTPQKVIPPGPTTGPAASPTRAIDMMGNDLARYQAAYNAGKLSPLALYQKQADLVKSMISKYGPGYTDDIMLRVARATGLNPANDIREELNRQFAKEQETANDSVKFRRNQGNQWIESGLAGRAGITPEMVQRAETDDALWLANQAAISNIASQDATITAAKNRLDLSASVDAENKKARYDNADARASQLGNEMMARLTSTADSFLSKSASFIADGTLTEDEMAQIDQAYPVARAQMYQQLHEALTKPDKNGTSFTEGLKEPQIKEIIDKQLASLDNYNVMLHDKDAGAMESYSRINKLRMQGFTNKVTESFLTDPRFELTRIRMAMKNAGFADASIENTITEYKGNLGALAGAREEAKAFAQLFSLNAQGGNIPEASKWLQQSVDSGALSPALTQQIMHDLGGALSNPSVTPEAKGKILNQFLDDKENFLNMFAQGRNGKEDVFNAMTNPTLAEELKNQPVLPKYTRWMQDNFTQIALPALQDIGTVNLTPAEVSLSFDEKGHWVPSFTLPNNTSSRLGMGQDQIKRQEAARLEERLRVLNNYADRYIEAVNATGGNGVESLRVLYQAAPIPPNMVLPNIMKQGAMPTTQDTGSIENPQFVQPASLTVDTQGLNLGDISQLPAGMRNNNPGNLKYSGSNFQRRNFAGMLGPSKNTDQGSPQIRFDTPQSGFNALVKLAELKYHQGMNTVDKIITGEGGWTPGYKPSARNIAKSMGISPNDPINLDDPNTMQSFVRALILQEHGPASNKYPDELIKNAIAMQ